MFGNAVETYGKVSAAYTTGSLAAGTAAATGPTIWTVLGYQFEAGAMFAALAACLATRVYVSGPFHWRVEPPIMIIVSLCSAASVIGFRPSLLLAIVFGTGFGVLGARFIKLAERRIAKVMPELEIEDDDAEAGFARQLDRLDQKTRDR